MGPVKKKRRLSDGNGGAVEGSKQSQDEKPEQKRSLFVRSLPATATSESLTELFSENYPIKHATAVIDQATKQCRGYGFVTFVAAEDAQRARDEFNGHAWEGRKLRVELAEPRQRDAEKGGKDTETPKIGKQRQQDVPQPSRLIVRNLPWTIKTSDDLSKLFMSYGKVKQAYIPKKHTGLSAGFGFVVLRGRKNAEKAVEGVNGKEADGRTLAVDWAVSKDEYESLVQKGKDGVLDGTAAADGSAAEDETLVTEFGAGAEATEEMEDEADDEVGSGDGLDSSGASSAEEGKDTDAHAEKSEDRSTTIFVRNLPFICTDEDLEDHFSGFGNVRYARIVMDPVTERSRGTGFVCFYRKDDAEICLRGAPRRIVSVNTSDAKEAKTKMSTSSILQNEETDPSGKYTLDGRVLQVSPALNKSEASRLTEEGAAHRRKNKEDKRRLYLLSEGTISSNSSLYEQLSPSERNMREASAKQRKALIESNPSLHLSLTRLSIRNIPRSVGSKDLKALAREAVVGFATDAKAGSRQPISKEELSRSGEDMQAAEQARKKAGKGVVKQAKVVFEGAGGSKVSEDTGAGRSRGYGFVEYHTHRSALMGLRWLNGHAIDYRVKGNTKIKVDKDEVQDRKKRLIVEFAIENAQVVMRRQDKEHKARDRSQAVERGQDKDGRTENDPQAGGVSSTERPGKRKRDAGNSDMGKPKKHRTHKPSELTSSAEITSRQKKPADDKIAHRNQVIGRKRAMRKARKGAKS